MRLVLKNFAAPRNCTPYVHMGLNSSLPIERKFGGKFYTRLKLKLKSGSGNRKRSFSMRVLLGM